MYIRATGNISPQKTFGHPPFLAEPIVFAGNRLTCSEPDYKDIIDIKLIRRMSRIIRMGVTAAMECLLEAGIEKPDAIVTGTSYGCLDDTGSFLTRMVEFNEELLTPTSFIQSTHNTIGAQIGLMLQCNNYNNAFVHRGFSFESALTDALMLLNENAAKHVLVGAVDEITNMSHDILSRFRLFKKGSVSSLDLYKSGSKGTLNGEGASFFLMAKEPSGKDYARLEGFTTFYKPAGTQEIENEILAFLVSQSVALEDIQLVITGKNGAAESDNLFSQLGIGIFRNNRTVDFKHLCGDYPTASGFALWLAANIIKHKNIPDVLGRGVAGIDRINRILIYNHYQNIHHSLYLIAAC